MKKINNPNKLPNPNFQILNSLKTVIDPELGINIVDLGLIYNVSTTPIQPSGWRVYIRMTLTSPGCPLAGPINSMIKDAVYNTPDLEISQIDTQLTFDPPWTPEMMSAEAKAQLGYD